MKFARVSDEEAGESCGRICGVGVTLRVRPRAPGSVPKRGATDGGEGNDGRSDHPPQLDETITQRLESLAKRREENTDQKADDDGDEDLGVNVLEDFAVWES